MRSGPGVESGAGWWSNRVVQYNEFIRRVVPGYDEQLARLVRCLPDARRVFELGCGTGNLSLALAAWNRTADFSFVDAVPEMLDVTRARLSAMFPDVTLRARFIESYFERLPLEPDSCDLVVSSLAIHHVADKASLFRMLCEAITPGGSLRFVDGLAGASERNHRLSWDAYVGHWTSRCTDDEIRDLLEHADQHDHYRTLREHFHLLEAAGFVDCDCVWRDGLWTIVTAEVPAG